MDEGEEVDQDSKERLKQFMKNQPPVYEGTMFMEFEGASREDLEETAAAKLDEPASGKQWQTLAGLILRDENSKGL